MWIKRSDDPQQRGVDNSYDYTLAACDASLERLGDAVSVIDLYYVHRIANNGTQLDECMKAMAKLLIRVKSKRLVYQKLLQSKYKLLMMPCVIIQTRSMVSLHYNQNIP